MKNSQTLACILFGIVAGGFACSAPPLGSPPGSEPAPEAAVTPPTATLREGRGTNQRPDRATQSETFTTLRSNKTGYELVPKVDGWYLTFHSQEIRFPNKDPLPPEYDLETTFGTVAVDTDPKKHSTYAEFGMIPNRSGKLGSAFFTVKVPITNQVDPLVAKPPTNLAGDINPKAPFLVLQDDGNVVLYSEDSSNKAVLWSFWDNCPYPRGPSGKNPCQLDGSDSPSQDGDVCESISGPTSCGGLTCCNDGKCHSVCK